MPPWAGPGPQALERRTQGLRGLEALDRVWEQLEAALHEGDEVAARRLVQGLARKRRKLLSPLSRERVTALRQRTVRHLNRYRSTLRLAESAEAGALWATLLAQLPPPSPPPGTGHIYSRLGRTHLHYKLNCPRPELPLETDRDLLLLSFELEDPDQRDAFTVTWEWPDDRPEALEIEAETERPVPDTVRREAEQIVRDRHREVETINPRVSWHASLERQERCFCPDVPLRWQVALTCTSADGRTFQALYDPSDPGP